MKIFTTTTLALVALVLALAQVSSGFKIWKKICKPVGARENLLVLFPKVRCEMVLVDPFEPLLKFFNNKPIVLFKTTTISSRTRAYGSISRSTTSNYWGGFEPDTTPAPEPAGTSSEPAGMSSEPADAPSGYNTVPEVVDSSTTTDAEPSSPASFEPIETTTILPDPTQATTSRTFAETSILPVASERTLAPTESASSVQQTSPVTEATTALTEATVQPAVSSSTPTAPAEDSSLSGRDDSLDRASTPEGEPATTTQQANPTADSSTTATEPAVQTTTLEPLPVSDASSANPTPSDASSANPTPSDTPVSTQTEAPSNPETAPTEAAQPDESPSSTSAAPIADSRVDKTPSSPVESTVTEPSTSENSYAPTLTEVIVSASTQPPTTAAVTESVGSSSPPESLQKDSSNVSDTTGPYESTPTEATQTLVVSSATTSSTADPMPEAAPSPAPLLHDPTISEAPATTDPKSRKEDFTEAMEPN